MSQHVDRGVVLDAADGPLYIISDIHAGALRADVELIVMAKLATLLEHVASMGGQLIVAGDLFDFWQESNSRVPRQLKAWLALFASCKVPSKPTIFITGNHDHWAGNALQNYGFTVIYDHVLILTSSKPWMVLHGDGLPSNDLKLVRKGLNQQFRKASNNTVFNLLPFEWRVFIMRAFSNYRRQRGLDHQENSRIQNHLADWLDTHDFLGVVFGHTHEAHFSEKNGKYLINTGTFSSDGTTLVIRDTIPTMTNVDRLTNA